MPWRLVPGRMPRLCRESHYYDILRSVIEEGVSEVRVEYPRKSARSLYAGLKHCVAHVEEFAHLSVHLRGNEVWICSEKEG